MNRREAMIISTIIFASLVGTVFASTSPSSPSSSLTPQTTSVDIEALQAQTNFPGQGVLVLNCGTGVSCAGVRFVNFTAGFSFAPLKNFVQVNSAILTIIYNQVSSSTTAYASPDSFSVEINGNSPTLLGTTVVSSSTGTSTSHSVQGLPVKVGANMLNIGIASVGTSPSQAFLYEVRVTVEYTYLT